MFKQVTNNNMIQTITSFLQRVQLYDGDAEPFDEQLDSPNHLSGPSEGAVPRAKILASKPIPYSLTTALSLKETYSAASLNSEGYESSVNSSLTYEESIGASEDFNPYSDSVYCEVYDDKSTDEDENTYEEEVAAKLDEEQKCISTDESVGLREICLNEVAQHDSFHNCWMVFYDKVYDVTPFLLEHPGGEELLMEHAGRDGTLAFRSVGHSRAAIDSLKDYLIGVLPKHERIFCNWDTN